MTDSIVVLAGLLDFFELVHEEKYFETGEIRTLGSGNVGLSRAYDRRVLAR